MSGAMEVTEVISAAERLTHASILGVESLESLQMKRVLVDQCKLKRLVNDNEFVPFVRKLEASTRTVVSLPETNLHLKTRTSVHLKIVGLLEDILVAEDEVIRVLGAPGNAVTLKLNVSHTSHSHIIGRDGGNIKKIRKETSCNIHFPDSNLKEDNQKNNHVFISGHVDDVEKARIRLREFSPLVLTYRLPGETPPTVLNSSRIMKIKQDYGVQVNFKVYTKFPATMVIVSGPSTNPESVQVATRLLIIEMCGEIGPIQVQTTMEVSPRYHSAILGVGKKNIEDIMWCTKTTIVAFRNISSAKQNNVTVSGNINDVCLARQKLLDLMPMVLIFKVPPQFNADRLEDEACRIVRSQGVIINIKAKQAYYVVSIQGAEGNSNSVYEIRRQLLGVAGAQPCPKMNIPVDSQCSSPRSSTGDFSDSPRSSDDPTSIVNKARPFELWTGYRFDWTVTSQNHERTPKKSLDLQSFLSGAGLRKYVGLFERKGIDLTGFLALQDDNLEQIGVHSWETRRKMLMLGVQLKKFLADKRRCTHESRKSDFYESPPVVETKPGPTSGNGNPWVPYSKSAISETETSSSDFSPLRNIFLNPDLSWVQSFHNECC